MPKKIIMPPSKPEIRRCKNFRHTHTPYYISSPCTNGDNSRQHSKQHLAVFHFAVFSCSLFPAWFKEPSILLLQRTVYRGSRMSMFDIDIAQSVQRIAIAFLPIMLGMVCHEVAHGWVANLQGDPTAKTQGRLTLNPVSHLDPMGTFMFVLTTLTSPFVIGWAKPVPVNPRWFKNPRMGMVWVAAAGPATNFVLAFLFALVLGMANNNISLFELVGRSTFEFILNTCYVGVKINVMLAWFNLMPFPPLDGSKIIGGLLPPSLAWSYMRLERFGMLLVILLLATGMLGKIVWPLVDSTTSIILALAGVS